VLKKNWKRRSEAMVLPKFVIEKKYSIGRLERPQPDDEQFDDFVDAEVKAIEESIDDAVWAVWENESGEILAIVYMQVVYRP
jgi:hypothetical protein